MSCKSKKPKKVIRKGVSTSVHNSVRNQLKQARSKLELSNAMLVAVIRQLGTVLTGEITVTLDPETMEGSQGGIVTAATQDDGRIILRLTDS